MKAYCGAMLQISALSKSFGPQVLFEGVTMKLNPGHRYGLVGANGAGKTTFLKVLTGDEPASDGEVMLPKGARMGVLRQDRFMDDGQRVVEVCMAGDEAVYSALQEQERESHAAEPDAARLAELEELIAVRDGYTLEARASAILVGLGVAQKELKQPLGVLSGGFKLRVLLAQVLVAKPEVLLLDEPTNHLDILSIRWLEGFLKTYEGCAVVISHDQHFLNSVATDIMDVDYGTITSYVGDYQAFLRQKEQTREQKEAQIAKAERIIAEKKAFVERFKAKATKARQAQSRVKQIEKIVIEELPPTSRCAPRFRFEAKRKSGREVVAIEGVSKSFDDKHVLRDAAFTIRRGERVAVIGANGLGKSTLLKILTDRLALDSGKVEWGHETHVGYFAQDHKDLLADANHTPLSYAWEACPSEGTAYVRGFLGRVLFSGDDVEKPVHSLSGGEAARLIFCRIMIEKPNVLVLDEPSNHLDLESITALVDSLLEFDGTLVFVSHDRWFVSKLATRVIEITSDGLRDFPGTYDEYLARAGEDHLDKNAVARRAKLEQKDRKAADATDSSALSWEQRKRMKNRLKALPRKRDELFEEIAVTEERVEGIRARYCEAGFFENTPTEKIEALRSQESELAKLVDDLTAQWEKVEEELEELSGHPELL